MHLKLLAQGKKTKTQHFKMLRMQAFVPEGIKSKECSWSKAASPSPPRIHGHIAKQQRMELSNIGQGN